MNISLYMQEVQNWVKEIQSDRGRDPKHLMENCDKLEEYGRKIHDDALIGFAGPRVIEQTLKQKLPEGFQRSEFLLEHGFIDKIVTRKDMKDTLSQILKLHKGGNNND